MSQRLGNLNHIISVLEAGAKFYRDAARRRLGAAEETIFIEHAELRESVSKELSDVVDTAGGEPAEASTLESARALAAKAAAFVDTSEHALVSALEEHEDRTLEAFRTALRDRDNEQDEAMLRTHFAAFEQAHARMRALRQDERPESLGNATG